MGNLPHLAAAAQARGAVTAALGKRDVKLHATHPAPEAQPRALPQPRLFRLEQFADLNDCRRHVVSGLLSTVAQQVKPSHYDLTGRA